MPEATTHRLPLLTFLIEPPVLLLWAISTLFTWVLFLLTPESIIFFIVLMLYLVFAAFFVNYGFDIIESTALGHARAPSLGKAFSGSPRRLARQILLIAIGLTMIRFTPVPMQWVTISMLLAVAPAITSSIVFHEKVITALDPLRIWQFISNMGFGYMALRLMTTSVLLICLFIASGELDLSATTEGKAAVAGGAVMLLLMMFRATGTLLHIRRENLGIRTEFSTEQSEQLARDRELQKASDFLAEVKREFKLKGTDSAYKMLMVELKRHKFRDDAIYFELLKDMADRRLLYRFAGGYVGRLIEAETSRAWATLLDMYRESRGEFQLGAGIDLLRLVKTAETREERLVLLDLLERFEQDFPQHPDVKEAWLSAAELALQLNDRNRARSHLARTESTSGRIDEARLKRTREQLED